MFIQHVWEKSMPQLLLTHRYTMTEGLWRQYRESDVMRLQTLRGIRRNITHCHKKHKPASPARTLPDRLLRETSSGRE